MKPLLSGEKAEFWIHRILDEKTTQLKILAEEISVLNHQAQNFKKMQWYSKSLVLGELNKHFEALDWECKFNTEEYHVE